MLARSGILMEEHTGDDAVGQVGNPDVDHEGESVAGDSCNESDSRILDICSEEEREMAEDGGNDVIDGWAETMAKILGKKTAKNKKNILVKSKELEKLKATKRKKMLETKKQLDKKRMWEMMLREKPDIVKDRETERALQRIATRGVVQLFNSVRKHQKTTNDLLKEVGGSERKKSKILSSFSKRDFITALRKTAEDSRVSDKPEDDSVPELEVKPSWSVLTEDFMMEATMKDWDKN